MNVKTLPEGRVLTTKQVAHMIGVSKFWLNQRRTESHEKSGPPFYRLGPRTIRYLEHEVREWWSSIRNN